MGLDNKIKTTSKNVRQILNLEFVGKGKLKPGEWCSSFDGAC